MVYRLLYWLGWTVLRAYSLLLFRLRVHWHAPLPPGRKLIAANHPSCTDPFILPLLSRTEISILITGRAFQVPIFSFLLRKWRQISVVQGNGRQALEEARSRLEAEGTVAIFPEGRLSPRQGGYLPPRPGVIRLAMLTGAPIIPVGIYYPREKSVYLSKRMGDEEWDGYWYLAGPYEITVGEPLYVSGDPDDREQVTEASLRLMEIIAHLAEESRLRMHASIPALATIEET